MQEILSIKSNNIKQPLVSVILPTFNHGRFISKAIESVLNQTYSNFELIIIDNHSEDNTEEVVAFYKDNRINYLKFRNNGIIAASRNYGIKHSRGKYVAFLDSDDTWYKQKLKKQLPHFQMPEIIGVASNATLITETPYYRNINLAKSKLGYIDYQYRNILNRNPIITSSLIVRKETLKQAGLFDENRDFCFIEDWELWLRMARYGSFRVIEEPLLYYRASLKRGAKAATISKNCLKILEKQVNLNYVKSDDSIEPKASIYLSIARNLLEFDQRQSRKYYMKALKTTSDLRKKIKSCAGVSISFQPLCLKKMMLLILYKIDRALCSLKDWLWKIVKIFC